VIGLVIGFIARVNSITSESLTTTTDSLQLTTESQLTDSQLSHNSNWVSSGLSHDDQLCWVSCQGPGPPADPHHSLRTVDSDCSASGLLARAKNILSRTDWLIDASLKTLKTDFTPAGSELYSLGTDSGENTSTIESAHCCVSSRYQGTRSSSVDPSGLQRARHNVVKSLVGLRGEGQQQFNRPIDHFLPLFRSLVLLFT
jgi:hypothetical protein